MQDKINTAMVDSVVLVSLLLVLLSLTCVDGQSVTVTTSPVECGMTATLNCSLVPSSAFNFIVWKINTVQVFVYFPSNPGLTGGRGVYENRTSGFSTGSFHTLSLFNVSKNDAETYTCDVVTTSGTLSSQSDLSIITRPIITVVPAKSETEVKEPVNFTCSSGPANPQANLLWDCLDNSSSNCQFDKTTESANSSTCESYVTTLSVTCQPVRNTTCTCQMEYQGVVTNSAVGLFVIANPNITSEIDNQTLTTGLNYTFHCEAEGFPSPSVTWIKEDSGKTVSNSSFLNFINAAVSDSGWYICNASSPYGVYDYMKIYIQVIGDTTMTTMSTGTYTKRPADPPVSMDAITTTAVVLSGISFIVNCFLCILVYKKFPDVSFSVAGVVDWVCIVVTSCCVVLGDVCGVIAWTRIDKGQQLGIILMSVVLIDLGFFILGVVAGVAKGSSIQKSGSDETRPVILRKLVHIVWSVATFGGVSLGIVIKYKHKVQDPNTRTANGGRRHISNSVTPAVQDPPRRETSMNSEDSGSAASQSKVPLQEHKEGITKKDKEVISMKKPTKKNKKKKVDSKNQYPVQKVGTPRKLPPLKSENHNNKTFDS